MKLEKYIEKASSITQDSREVKKDSIFFAVEGWEKDGHQYVGKALDAGALLVVIKKGHPTEEEFKYNKQVLAVNDPRKELGKAASLFFKNPSEKMIVCGITGTNGKTTTSYILEKILQTAGKKTAVIGTIERRFEEFTIPTVHTTPLPIDLQQTLATFADKGAEAVVMEVSSHGLEQERTWGTQFDTAIFTNFSQDHLDYHKTMAEYFLSKAKLFLDYQVPVRVIHVDTKKEDCYGRKLIELCKKESLSTVSVGNGEEFDVDYSKLSTTTLGITGKLLYRKKKVTISCSLIGEFNIQNISCAVAAALELGIPAEAIEKAMIAFDKVPGRLERVQRTNGLRVYVDFAHTPDALENALHTLKEICEGKLFCLFGCGGDRDQSKRSLMGKSAESVADKLIITSDNPRNEDPEKIISNITGGLKSADKALVIGDRKSAIEKAISLMEHSDILLIAGKGHENYQIIGNKKVPFDDRKIAQDTLNG